ncbi:MAG: hypothetical protein AW10_01712 [Candidatus Accumulibacter appositus]|uniref:Uncharacterized protein n=1 Tax=Candidatus Accumulibacter appositus TaxID=1454003 RepID=A0A011QNY6_9PROT|nr:MAG: hypothetical protein AW10_01712 [Candidatus Accumulibacter appositus]
MEIAYRTSATYFVYLQTISDRDGRWLLGRMRLTWPLSIAKEEGVGCARHAVFALLLAPLCAGAVRTASACFLSRFRATCCLAPQAAGSGRGAGPFDPGRPRVCLGISARKPRQRGRFVRCRRHYGCPRDRRGGMCGAHRPSLARALQGGECWPAYAAPRAAASAGSLDSERRYSTHPSTSRMTDQRGFLDVAPRPRIQ